jgi:hypothetical protein
MMLPDECSDEKDMCNGIAKTYKINSRWSVWSLHFDSTFLIGKHNKCYLCQNTDTDYLFVVEFGIMSL